MVKMKVVYGRDLHCEILHLPSGSAIETDAPVDNHGKGERFSPTDLLGAALASCVLTTMAMVAERDGQPFKGARAEVEKHMVTQPTRRVGSLPLVVYLPAAIPLEYRAKLERVAHQCPVHKSLHPDIAIQFRFIYE